MEVANTDSRSSRDEWRAGWGIVLTAMVGVGVGACIFNLYGVMLKPMEAAYGWSRGDASAGFTIITSIYIVSNVILGNLVDRFGPRPVALCGTLLFGVAMSLLGLAGPKLWTLYAACAGFGLLSTGASIIVWTTSIVRRFKRQRGLALAASLAGSGVMAAILPTLALALHRSLGVRGVFFVIGGVGSALMFGLTWWLFRDEGGAAQSDRAGVHTRAAAVSAKLPGLTVKGTLSSVRYWQLAVALGLVALCVSVFTVHLQPLLNDTGMTPATAATIAFFIGPSLMIGRLFTGALFDHFDMRAVSCLAFGMPAVGCLLLSNLDGSYAAAAVAGVVVGLCIGAESDVVAYLTSRYFGLRSYGTVYGTLVSIYGFGIGAGAGLIGRFYDLTGSYGPVLAYLAGGSGIAAVLAATLGRAPLHEPRVSGGNHAAKSAAA